MAWDFFGILRRQKGSDPKRAKQTSQALSDLQPAGKGTSGKEKGYVTQVPLVNLPWDRVQQRWERKKLVGEVNRYVHTDPRLSRANQRKAQAAIGKGITVTVQGAEGRTRTAKVSRQAQEIMNRMLRDTKLNAKLVSWSRLLLREGELDINVIIDHQECRIVALQRLPTVTIQRNEDVEGNFPDVERAFTQVDPQSLEPMRDPTTGQERHFPLYALNTIRYMYDDGELYGVPAYAPGLRYAQMMQDTEDHMFIRRMVRAGLRFIFSVLRADGSAATWDEVQEVRDENKDFEDPALIAKAVTQNLWANQQVKADAVQGDAKLDEIGDVNFLQEQLWIAAETPKGLLGYGEHVNRDVLKEQQQEYNKDLDHLCFLLEHGDGGPYSGLRAIFDFALEIQGINPDEVSYAIQWTEHTNETKTDRAKYVLDLYQRRVISRRRALHLLSNDLGIDSESDIDALLTEMEEEGAQPPTGPVPGNGDGRSMTPDDLNPAGDAPEEALVTLRSGMERRVRDRGRRVWRRVQKQPELRSLLTQLAEDTSHLSKDSGDHTAIFHDSAAHACGHSHGADASRKRDKNLPESALGIIALIEAALAEEDSLLLRAGYIVAARKGVLEAAITVESSSRALPEAVTLAVAEGIPIRWAGIDETTVSEVEQAIRRGAGATLEASQWAKLLQMAVEMPEWRRKEIAGNEQVWAYHEGALGLYEQSGVARVIRNETETACDACAPQSGIIYRIEDAHNVLPAHPNCYGWWSPVSSSRR